MIYTQTSSDCVDVQVVLDQYDCVDANVDPGLTVCKDQVVSFQIDMLIYQCILLTNRMIPLHTISL